MALPPHIPCPPPPEKTKVSPTWKRNPHPSHPARKALEGRRRKGKLTPPPVESNIAEHKANNLRLGPLALALEVCLLFICGEEFKIKYF